MTRMSQDAAATLLANDLTNALRAPDLTVARVCTPGFATDGMGTQSMTVVDLFSDLFAGKTGDKALAELLSITAAAARGEVVTHRALVWIARMAIEHAEFHAADLAAEINDHAREAA